MHFVYLSNLYLQKTVKILIPEAFEASGITANSLLRL